MANDETQLVKRAVAGNAEAFAELVRRYRDAIYGYCYHRTGSFEDARDLAQDALIRAYTRLDQLRDPERFGGWVRRIAANLCTRWAQSRRESTVECIDPDEAPRESPRAVAVREALSSLPNNERLAVVLHYVNGYSYGDIADFLEVSKASVRGRLARGREMLKAEVLKMTKETFDENKLDEKFVIQAVNAAIREARDAYNVLGDKDESRRKVDEAAALIDGPALDKLNDPIALAHALLALGSREHIVGQRDRAHEHWDRAKSLFERAGDQGGIEECRAAVAYERLGDGDLAGAHELYSRTAEYWLGRPSEEQKMTGYGNLAVARALESLGVDSDWSRVAAFHAGTYGFEREDGQTIQHGGFHMGFHKEGWPARLNCAPPPGPLCGPTQLPLVLIRNKPEVGDTLRFVNQWDGRAEESVLESLSETITTPAGTFENCAHSSSRIFASKDWTDDVVATRKLWLAPGVGIVRISYQKVGQLVDTSELIGYHIETPSTDYIPLAVGNWWKWRWIEGEEEFGFRAESYGEIMLAEQNRWLCTAYTFAVRSQ